MSLEQVLARSRQRTRMTERRRFTVASDKAFEKQKLFAMQNPEDWVLRAFQAAVFSRADLVGMDTRPTQVTLGWMGGLGVLPEELDDLFQYLLTDRSAEDTRHLSQLALAVVGALAMKPVEVRVESIGVGQPVCLVIDADGEARVGEPAVGIDGTYITVQKHHAWFRRFHDVAPSAEIGRLWGASRYSPVPLLINPVTAYEYSRFGYVDGTADLTGRKGERRYTLWANDNTREYADDTLSIVVGGILIEQIAVPGLGMAGVVSDDGLRLSADQSKVARGPRWARLLHFLHPRVVLHLKNEGLNPPQVHLPAIDEDDADEAVAPPAPTAPVPDMIGTVPPRPQLVCPSGPGPALLYVLPDDVEQMQEDLDPYELPLQVAVLTEPQAETVRQGGRPAHRLAAGAGVAFVRRMAVADEVLATGVVEEGHLRLTLRLHPGNALPPWGRPQAPLPLVVRHEGRTVHCGGVGLALPGCSAVVEGTHDVGAAIDLVLRRGLEAAEEVAGSQNEAARALLLHLVGHLGIPHLVEGDGEVRLDVVLPPALAHARRLPLVQELDLAGVLSLAGSTDTVEVDDVDAYAALEAWLGFGHLVDGSVECGVLVAVGFDGERWKPVNRLGAGGVSQVLAVLPTFRPAPLPKDRERKTTVPLPLFAVYKKERTDWALGARALMDLAHRRARDSERLTAMLPLVSVLLARMAGRSGQDLHPADGKRVQAAAVGGLQSLGDNVLPVTVDTYRALLPDVRLPLHLDDEGDVWGAPDTHDWVLRLPVEARGVDGWVGLRRPFDPTGAVFLHRSDGHVGVLTDFGARFPAHGVLRARAQLAVDGYSLLLPGLQLYRSLAVWLRAHPDDEDARHYARHLVLTDVASPLVPELAPYVELEGGGSLEAWLAMEPERRPPLAEPDQAFAFVPSAVGASKWVERLQAALDAACGRPVAVQGMQGHGRFGASARPWGLRDDGRVGITVWLRGADQVFQAPREVEILLLDGLRVAAATLQGEGHDVDLAAGVEVLAAGR